MTHIVLRGLNRKKISMDSFENAIKGKLIDNGCFFFGILFHFFTQFQHLYKNLRRENFILDPHCPKHSCNHSLLLNLLELLIFSVNSLILMFVLGYTYHINTIMYKHFF